MANDQPSGSTDATRGVAGFTLLEMIISLTILCLVVLTVYTAFSLGVDVWRRMEEGEKSAAQRKAIALRLLHGDFSNLRPYTWNSEKGRILFFAGGPKSVFYVTTNGLGATNRRGKALFFTCLFVHASAEGEGSAVYVYKSGLPGPNLAELLRDFRAGGDLQRTNFVPPAFILEHSVQVIKNVHDAQFGYQRQAYPPFSGVKAEVEDVQSTQSEEERVLAQSQWVENELPGQISFRARDETGGFLVRTVCSTSPLLDHAAR